MKRGKKAQGVFGMSFGVIFSIILIIFFIIIAFIVIGKFIGWGKCDEVKGFIEGFEGKVNDAWSYERYDEEFSKNLPNEIDFVCFVNSSKTLTRNDEIGKEIGLYKRKDYNMHFYPAKNACDILGYNILHLNIEEITSDENPYCIPVKDGKIKIKIEKEFNQPLVMIE